jgi:Protein of unknown function (Hypoth_ymh)
MLLGEPMESRNIDDIDRELEQLISFTENGGGFGDPDAEKVHDRKIQFLLSLRAQEISRNKATDSDLSTPDLSAIPHLIPLTEVKHLDSELWERCRFSLSSGGDDPKAWDKAVRTATVVLEERLRKLGKTESINRNATGEGIVNIIFAGKNPVLAGKLDEKQLKSYRDLYAGMMAVFRNPYAHRIIDPSPEVGGATIAFIDLLLKTLDNLDWDSSGDES